MRYYMYKIFPLTVYGSSCYKNISSDHKKNLNQDNWVLAGQKYEYFQEKYIASKGSIRT